MTGAAFGRDRGYARRMATETINIFTDQGLVQVVVPVPPEYATEGPERDAFSSGVDAGVRALWEALSGGPMTQVGESVEPTDPRS